MTNGGNPPAPAGHEARMAEELPLFPLRAVLFPGGLLSLKVFEARYLDLMSRCLREGSPFGVVALRRGGEVDLRDGAGVALEDGGVAAELIDVDMPQAGILQVRCRGTRRFALRSSRREADGLWQGEVEWLADDAIGPPEAALAASARALTDAVAALRAQGTLPFLEPLAFDDAGWVANRWCELLPLSLEAKQRLMLLADPQQRLRLVDAFRRREGVVG